MSRLLEVLRDRNELYRETLSGRIENTYTLKVANKTQQPQTILLEVEGLVQPDWRGQRQWQLAPGRCGWCRSACRWPTAA
ncbi:hypothetical protein MBH78_18405 [Oceanimonas sp. NS1]|nr:hypothetical protein [Oceanimonas sp. NS1]